MNTKQILPRIEAAIEELGNVRAELDAMRTRAEGAEASLREISKLVILQHRPDLVDNSIHLAREVDRLKSEKAAEIEAAPEPITVAGRFKVGDRVINTEIVCHAANVLAFFDAIDGVRFVAVENDWRQSHFWRLDLVAKVNS